jgi:hypothetical protein
VSTDSKEEMQEVAKLLLSALRTAALKAKIDAAEIETIGIALKAGMIGPDDAVAWLNEIGLVDAVITDEVRS